MSGVSSTHHLFCVEYLADNFVYGNRTVDLTVSWGERREAGHVEVQSRERNQVGHHFSQVTIEMAWEAQ